MRLKGLPGLFHTTNPTMRRTASAKLTDLEDEVMGDQADVLVGSPWGLVEGLGWEEQHTSHCGGVREVSIDEAIRDYVDDLPPPE